MRKGAGTRLGLVEAVLQIVDLVPERRDTVESRRLADEVGDEEPQKQLALHRDEARGGSGVLAKGVEAFVRERVDRSLARLPRLLPRVQVSEPREPLRLGVVLALAGPV